MRRVAVVLALGLGVALAPPASAGTVELGWKEAAKLQGKAAVTFTMDRLVLNGNTWVVTATFRNETGTILRIRQQFGLAEFVRDHVFSKPARFLPAVTFRPRLPSALAPGQSWSGAFGGVGSPNGDRFVRVVFGLFVTTLPKPLGPQFSWISDHAYHVSALAL